MLTFYTIPPSLYCAKTRILLRHKGLEWQELPPPGGYGSDEYKTIVPSGNLPALIGERFYLGDSEVIAEYLNDVHPDPPMLPSAPVERARCRELSRFHDTRLEPELRKLFPHLAPEARDERVAARQSVALTARLLQLADLLRNPLPKMLTLGDCGYPITMAWIDVLTPEMGLDVSVPAEVTAYLHQLQDYPAVAGELLSYKLILKAFMETRAA